MIKVEEVFWGRNLLKLCLAVIFLLIGFVLGLNVLNLEDLALILFGFLFSFVGYSLPPIIEKVGTRAAGGLIEKMAIEVAQQLRHRIGQPATWVRHRQDQEESQEGCPPMIIDTSAIIDGRIVEIAKTGICYGKMIVPKFVLAELQRVADSSERVPRERGRRGLELLEELKKSEDVDLVIQEKGLPRGKDVDGRLVKLAKKLSGIVVTTDYNLNKVAGLHGIKIFNVNELSNALRPLVVPGEVLKIRVVQTGKEPGQGVGYLSDGTMVVVEDGEKLVEQEVEVTVSRFLQTAAGRMIFARHANSRTTLDLL